MIVLLSVFIFTVVIDQISKYIFLTRFSDLVYYNDAIAFSLPIPWYLPWIVILITILLMFFQNLGKKHYRWNELKEMLSSDRILSVSFGFIIGGAVGNLIDRFVYNGRVIDFIDLKFWPVFNLADSAIVVGVLLFLFRSYIKRGVETN